MIRYYIITERKAVLRYNLASIIKRNDRKYKNINKKFIKRLIEIITSGIRVYFPFVSLLSVFFYNKPAFLLYYSKD